MAGRLHARVLTFGASEGSDARLARTHRHGSQARRSVRACSRPRDSLRSRRAGRAYGGERGRRSARRRAFSAGICMVRRSARRFSPPKGRGARFALATPGGTATLIDESYNANPASMRAALALLGAAKVGPNGRRIAVIGDMLELGAEGAAMHAALAADLQANGVDLLFGAGPLTRALYDAAPAPMRGAWAETSGDLAPARRRRLRERRRRDGQGLERQSHGAAGRVLARALRHGGRSEPMLTWLADIPCAVRTPSTSSAISHSAPSARRGPDCFSSSSSGRRSSRRCGSSRARGSRSAPTDRRRICSPRRARRRWAG